MPRPTEETARPGRLAYAGFRYLGPTGELRPTLLATAAATGYLWAADLWANALTRPWLRRLWFEALIDTDLLFREIEPADLHYILLDLGVAESAFESWRSLDWRPMDRAEWKAMCQAEEKAEAAA